jgi:hypothetical protein
VQALAQIPQIRSIFEIPRRLSPIMSNDESNDSNQRPLSHLAVTKMGDVTIGEVKNRSVTKDNRWSLELT